MNEQLFLIIEKLFMIQHPRSYFKCLLVVVFVVVVAGKKETE
jgi:hypothetical protein